MAFENQEVSLHAVVDFRDDDGTWIQNTTVGRIFFNEILPQEVRFINELLGKKHIEKLVSKSYQVTETINGRFPR